MIIHDKALLRCLQAAYNTEGYRVAGDRDEDSGEPCLILCANSWAVRMERRICPKSILAKIVFHAGDLPEVGEAMLVRKKEIQTMLWEEATEALRTASALTKMAENPATMKWTGFTWKGLELWQEPKKKKIWMMDPAFTDMASICAGTSADCVGNMLHWKGIASDLYVCRVESSSEMGRQVIEHLEGKSWLEENK